ncbi:MAG: carboxypeptidase regulatory-like domain-containing protein [Epsilonproteobacteria bacterium]|nr:carboxypeptidase regulatory-like domain-containing protein [Campylobacterota bacterium]
MKNKVYLLVISFFLIMMQGCGDVTIDDGTATIPSSSSDVNNNSDEDDSSTTSSGILKIIGKITYDRVHVNSNGVGLDYNNITKEPAKQVVVKAIGTDGGTIATTTADDNGDYVLSNLPENTQIKVRVYAQLKKDGAGGWDVKVVDNTNGDSQYVIEGDFVSTGNSDSKRDLHASSGWDGNSYSGTRAAAPFAILGSIYQAMEKVKSADSNATFPLLVINWSKNNISSGNATEAELRDGLIGTSHFDGTELYILGDENGDTDEYDDHVMIHEWGHYFEANFSRADSIGGMHSNGDFLDIRVAFGEGWGNAWSAIATDNPIYFDTMGIRQADGFYMNIESAEKENPGWYSEASIQRILYDLYDNHDDGDDNLSLGFKPIYDVLVGPQKTTPAFTSIFTFITYLKEQRASDIDKIDDILASEDIDSIVDIYGKTIDSNQYSDMSGGAIDICTYNRYGVGNKLYNHRYIRFSIAQSDSYTLRMQQNNGSSSDPDFSLYKASPFTRIGTSDASVYAVEEATYTLTAGDYLLDISDFNNLTKACFDVTIN